jgi:hypothetical protein
MIYALRLATLWAGGLGLANSAIAQYQWLVDIEYSDPAGVINSPDDSARVTFWAAFPPKDYAFHNGKFDVIAHDPTGAGAWSQPERLLSGPSSQDGTINGEKIEGIVVGQLHFPSANIFANPANPIAAWTAVWSTSELGARTVPVTSETSEFSVYFSDMGISDNFVDLLHEGSAVINVVPAPASLGVFLLLAAGDRRRS